MSTRPQPPSQASKRAPAPTFQDVKEYIQGLTKVNLENSNANYRTTAFELCRVRTPHPAQDLDPCKPAPADYSRSGFGYQVRGPGTWHVWVRDRSTLATVAGSVVVDSSREVQAKLLNKINLKPVSTKPQPPPKPAPAPRFQGVREYIQGLTNVNLENSNANYRTAAFELCRVRSLHLAQDLYSCKLAPADYSRFDLVTNRSPGARPRNVARMGQGEVHVGHGGVGSR